MKSIKISFSLVPRVNREGKSSVRCRMAYSKIRKDFSTGIFINPALWNKSKQIALDDLPESNYINTQLSLITNKVHQAFLLLQIQETNFTVEDIYSLYKGEKLSKQYNVIEYFSEYKIRLTL